MDDAPFPYDGPPELCQPVVDALSRVIDPEAAMSIVDMGLGVAKTASLPLLQTEGPHRSCITSESA